jgi:hypothetical protein
MTKLAADREYGNYYEFSVKDRKAFSIYQSHIYNIYANIAMPAPADVGLYPNK